MSLSPPPNSRSRASSTTLRSPFTFSSLGRRRSASCLHQQDNSSPSSPSPPPSLSSPTNILLPPSSSSPLSSPSSPPSSMLSLIASRFLHWLHFQPEHSQACSTPTTPRSSTDEFVLPLSASAQKTTFGPEVHEKKLSTSLLHSQWRHAISSFPAPLILVILLFPASTALVLFSMSTLPITLAWPKTIADVAQLGRELHAYSQSGSGPVAHVISVMAISAVWKHAWSIPGSVVWNVLAGALFSPAFATILLTLLTTIGSLCATLLSAPLAPILTQFFPRALDMTRSALEGDPVADLQTSGTKGKTRSSAWVRLSILRLIGVIPWSGINIASGVCGVAISDCLLGTFIGSLPWTAVTCQIGDILQTVASTPSPTSQTIPSLLTSPEIILKLIFLSFLSLAPILGRDRLRALISHSAFAPTHGRSESPSEDQISRWAWVQAWRLKLRSRASDRTSTQELHVLVQEKLALQELPS
ncbi:hypothetical protein AMATHDRAFT_139239 [Amanita thiersii Skay4041]|uniref:VTT domain-containing protein n=1 Tax=Amanita thiersii Skay4041 TaxID=703135 RepID=A0A2A9NP77_9AGAR|nr:hypothetical protein AMATHDRAFT_139239 [Amanita thiersii Skay4041]